jgi:hypothetical protein
MSLMALRFTSDTDLECPLSGLSRLRNDAGGDENLRKETEKGQSFSLSQDREAALAPVNKSERQRVRS